MHLWTVMRSTNNRNGVGLARPLADPRLCTLIRATGQFDLGICDRRMLIWHCKGYRVGDCGLRAFRIQPHLPFSVAATACSAAAIPGDATNILSCSGICAMQLILSSGFMVGRYGTVLCLGCACPFLCMLASNVAIGCCCLDLCRKLFCVWG